MRGKGVWNSTPGKIKIYLVNKKEIFILIYN
jgi:hypothetical protein